MGDLGELASLVRVEVDVVHVERGRLEIGRGDAVTDGVVVGSDLRGCVPAEVAKVVELQVDTNLVVLKCDEGKCKTRVAAEPELERDVEGVCRCTVEELCRLVGLTAGTVIIACLTTLDEKVRELGDITNHLGITGLFASLLRELIPDVEPVAIVLINALATDFNLNRLDKIVTNPVEPAELCTRAV